MDSLVKQTRAFTLPELLVTLALLAIALSFGAPRFNALLAEQKSEAVLTELGNRIETARKQALMRAQTLTLCPSRDTRDTRNACAGRDDWRHGALLFVDEDASGILSDDSQIVRRFPPLAASGTIEWRSFGNRPWIQFKPNGLTPNQSGRLTYCPEGNPRTPKRLILNASGRVRHDDEDLTLACA